MLSAKIFIQLSINLSFLFARIGSCVVSFLIQLEVIEREYIKEKKLAFKDFEVRNLKQNYLYKLL